jgi:hypothetical protein
MTEADLVDLVERHRQELLMSVPPPDLLTRARRSRTLRRRRTAAFAGAIVVGAAVVVGAVHTVGQLRGSRSAAQVPVVPTPIGPTTRLVGSNGWVVRVPASWGTDRVGCDGVSAIRPSVLFDHHVGPVPGCRPASTTVPFVRISDEDFAGVPYRTISGVAVVRRPHADCPTCATLRVPAANVSFDIRAASTSGLGRIEASLRPISSQQVTVPVPTAVTGGRGALDLMTTVATGEGLRPRVFELPSRRPPGTFLRSEPPVGTPVDLGHGIALYFSAGDLGRYATTGSLARHGWRIFPVSTYDPSYGRAEAIRAAGVSSPSPARHPAFLRTLTITHEGPRRVVVRRRVVWLVVTPSPRGAVSIIAVDAATDHVIESQDAFHGRTSRAVR